jgi:hypothetical protein
MIWGTQEPPMSRLVPLILQLAAIPLLAACSDQPAAPRDAGRDVPDAGPGDARPESKTLPTVTCPGSPPSPPASGRCEVKPGGSALLVRGALLLPDRTLENGQLLVAGGKIACADCDCSKAAGASDATQLACAKGVVSPGLINPHDHIAWALARPVPVPPTVRYDHRHEWRTGKNGKPEVKYPKSNNSNDAIAWGEARMVMGGATATMSEGDAPGLLRNLDSDNIGLGKPAAQGKTFPLGDSSGQLLAQSCSYPTIPSATTIAGAGAYVPHVAEGVGPEARNEFLCLAGKQPGGVDATLANAAFIHSVGLSTIDILDLAGGSTAVIWSPRSNVSLYGFTARVTLMDRLGVRIALGTDWTISGSMNMLRELGCADYLSRVHYGGYFPRWRLWAMATANAAAAQGVGDVIGQLKEGYFADLAIFDGSKRSAHDAVIEAGAADVLLVMRGGTVLYGDEALVTALTPSAGQGCEPLDVCGVKKRLCVEREVGKTLDALKAAYGTVTPYELYFCGPPADEPSCVPSRPGEYEGKPSASDSDGDGIPNEKDNCPTIFNPLRPIDSGKQPDADGDRVGDDCDPCPLDANTSVCKSSPSPNDSDADGVPNDADNCPNVPNKDQQDGDGDKVGDACDPCPTKPNPGGAGCPFSVKDLRDRARGARPADGTRVALKGVLITAVRLTKSGSYGFYVREGKAPFEAIFVYTKGALPADEGGAQLKPGDVVSLEGTLAEFNSTDELDSPSKIVVSGSGEISPVEMKTAALAPGSASAEGMESQLVRVSAVKVVAKPSASSDAFLVADDGSDCGGAQPACAKVGDFYYDGGKLDGKPAASVGQAFSALSGMINGYKNDHTLDVRSDADLVP